MKDQVLEVRTLLESLPDSLSFSEAKILHQYHIVSNKKPKYCINIVSNEEKNRIAQGCPQPTSNSKWIGEFDYTWVNFCSKLLPYYDN